MRAISPLAEGADRLFAEEALKLGYELQVPLPYEREEYKKDFHDDASRRAFDDLLSKATAVFELEGELDANGNHLATTYGTVGRVVLDHCDLLVAIWDGLPARGDGGTAHVLELARHRHIPIVCLGINQFPDTFFSGERNEGIPLASVDYPDVVAKVVRPPWLSSQSRDDPDTNGAYFESASIKNPVLGRLWTWFVKLMRLGADLEEPTKQEQQIPDGDFKRYYERTDAIANRFAGLYRGAFLANYTLGLCAVFFALLGYADEERATGWLWSELAAILLVLILVVLLVKRRWHYRSVDCRYLAEQFRVMCYIYPVGLTAPPLRLAAHHLYTDVQRSWMEWRLRALLRQQPLPSAHWTASASARYYLDVIDGFVEGQRIYHSRNEVGLEKTVKHLEVLGWTFVGIAALACILHFGFHGPPVGPWLTLCAAGFPAAAATCHAIATQAEFRRLSERSGAMQKSLLSIRDRLRAMTSSGQISPAAFRRETESLAALMIEEVVDWQILYRKPVPPG